MIGSIRVIYLRGGLTLFPRVADFPWMWRGRSTFFSFSFRFLSRVDLVVGGEGAVHHIFVLVGRGGVHGEW